MRTNRSPVVAYLESRAGARMGQLITRLGAAPLHAPALSEAPDIDTGALREWLSHAHEVQDAIVIFQTGVGVAALFDAYEELALADDFANVLACATVVVRGPKPTAALRQRKIRIDLAAESPFTTTELLTALQSLALETRAVTVQRHGGPNPVLVAGLEARGAWVQELVAYRWRLPDDTVPLTRLLAALEEGAVDFLVVTTASQIHNLLNFADASGQREGCIRALAKVKVLSVGPTCSEALREAGIAVTAEASPPKLGPLMDLLAAHF